MQGYFLIVTHVRSKSKSKLQSAIPKRRNGDTVRKNWTKAGPQGKLPSSVAPCPVSMTPIALPFQLG